MFCTHCGEELRPGSRFCTNCGAVLRTDAPESTAAPGKKGRKALIATVIVLAVLVAALGGIALGQLLSRADSGSAQPSGGGVSVGQPGKGQQPGTAQPPVIATNQPVFPAEQPAAPSQQPVFPTTQPNTPSQPETPSQPANPSQPDGSLRLDHMEHMQNGEFHLEYPVFSGKRSEELNRLVEDFALGLGMGGSIVNNSYEADYRCEVTLVNDSIVSMVFCGTGYVPGAAHDFRDVIPLNVEIGTMRTITLWDIFAMDMDGFTDIVYAYGQPYGASWSVSAFDFPELMDLETEVYHGLTRAPVGFLTPRGPVLLTYVGITGVEWLDVLVPIELLRDYYNYDVIPWEKLYTNN